MKSKKIQTIINIVTMTNTAIIILIMYNLILNNIYNRSYLKNLLEKCYQYNNYTINKEEHLIDSKQINITKIMQTKDARKLEYLYNNDDVIRWYSNNIAMYNSKVNNIKKYAESKTEDYINPLSNEFEWWRYIDNSDYSYRCERIERYNNKKCLVVVFNSKTNGYKVWIDDSGCVLREEEYNGNILVKLIKYTVTINNVTTGDINLPNLEEYEFIDIKSEKQ